MSQGGALILGYHNIVSDQTPADRLEAHLAVRISRLETHVRFLASRYPMVDLDGARPADGRRGLVLTFDDGYSGVLLHALPVLERYQVPAYVFINPAHVGGWNPRDKLLGLTLYGNEDARRAVGNLFRIPRLRDRRRFFFLIRQAFWSTLPSRPEAVLTEIDAVFAQHADDTVRHALQMSRLLSWDELRILQTRGVRIGNHTHRHLELGRLPAEQVRSEIRRAQEMIQEHLGGDGGVISYPRNSVGPQVVTEAAAAGYRWGLTGTPGIISGLKTTLWAPRILVSPADGVHVLRWKASSVRLWARRTPAATLLRRARFQVLNSSG